MNNVILAGKVSSDVRYVGDGKEAHFTIEVKMEQKLKDNTITHSVEVPVSCYGYNAQNIDIPESGWVIVQGQAQMIKSDGGNMLTLIGSVIPAAVNCKLNTVSLLGRLGQDPDIQFFQSDNCRVTASLAVKRSKDITDWFNLEIWGQPAKTVSQYVSKGNNLAVVGNLKYETWTDKNTQEERFTWKVNVNRVTLCERNNGSGGGSETALSGYGNYDEDF